MIATAHKSEGSLCPAYGLRLCAVDRNRFFGRKWKCVILQLEGMAELVFVSIDAKSFWGGGRELQADQIGDWLVKNRRAPWLPRHPPKVRVERIMGNLFSAKFES